MDRTELIIIALILLLMAMTLVLLVLVSLNLQKQTTDARMPKRTENDHLRANTAHKKSTRDERAAVILQREHANFMNYDGDEQTPIDVEAILADRGYSR